MAFTYGLIQLSMAHSSQSEFRKAVLHYPKKARAMVTLHKSLVSVMAFCLQHLKENPAKIPTAMVEDLAKALTELKGLNHERCQLAGTIEEFLFTLSSEEQAKVVFSTNKQTNKQDRTLNEISLACVYSKG